jgi:putative PIN family toxin of toxin-antitoxin system
VKVVLDTNVWLDWLVFGDPGVAALRASFEKREAQILIDEACKAELVRVLGYRFYKETLSEDKQRACLAECRRIATRVERKEAPALPRCRDADDQKFLELALAGKADVLLTKDGKLLRLASRALPFRILRPTEFTPPNPP